MRVFTAAVTAALLATASTPALAAPPATTAPAAMARPLIAPVPDWVRPVAAPAVTAPADDLPIRILLSDQQIRFADGRQTVYSATLLQIQTPQGLVAGNLSLPWRPDSDILTVHTLRIHRGATVIDVLASGQSFTVVRREANLESAMLDGVLTANIQPEGLQVGDRLELATSVSSADPTLKGHVETLAAGWNGIPMARAHLRMTWPTALPLRLRATGTLAAPKPVRIGPLTQIELQQDDVKPLVLPKGAPRRFQIGRLLEASDFAGWADLAALMAPLYRTAAALPADGPLAAEVARIRALSPDPKVRTEAALALVQDRVRYVALAMGTGNLVPATAAETWSRRYGDCKGKTALLLGLLAALDVTAEPVLVSTVFGDGLDQRLPMAGLFDHVLVRATIAGTPYWLDGTRTGDTALDRIAVPGFGWGLPLLPAGAALVPMVPAPPALPLDEVSIRIDATAGLTVPAPVHIEQVYRGDLALGTRLSLANLSGDARDRALRDYWKGRYDFIDAVTTTTAFDPKTGEQRLVLDGTARMDWGSWGYETDGTAIGYKADFTRDPGPDRDAPFTVLYPWYSRTKEVILLPPGFETLKAGGAGDVDRTLAGVAYRRHVTLANNVFTVEKTERSLTPEFPAAEAPAAEAALRALAKDAVYVRKPAGYRVTSKEIDASLAETPKTAAAFVERGALLLSQENYALAIEEFDQALKLDPKSVWALANRGMAKIWINDAIGAARDLDAAAAIDPRNPVLLRARGRIAGNAGAFADAVAAFTASLAVDPDNGFALASRGWARYMTGDEDGALADSDAAIKVEPGDGFSYVLGAKILHARGQTDAAAAKIAAMTAAATPATLSTWLDAATAYRRIGRTADAMRAYDSALALRPVAAVHIARYASRPKADRAGRQADLDAVARLTPDSGFVQDERARMLDEAGDRAGAIALYTKAIAARPDKIRWYQERGIAYARDGKAAPAAADFKKARALAQNESDLNSLCFDKATANVALDTALAECDAALARTPDAPAILDSRAFVLFRMGRLDDALAGYDAALAKAPMLPASLYGRALVRARKGDTAGADRDFRTARRVDPDIDRTFAEYGLTG